LTKWHGFQQSTVSNLACNSYLFAFWYFLYSVLIRSGARAWASGIAASPFDVLIRFLERPVLSLSTGQLAMVGGGFSVWPEAKTYIWMTPVLGMCWESVIEGGCEERAKVGRAGGFRKGPADLMEVWLIRRKIQKLAVI
jgi:hypothetical protein